MTIIDWLFYASDSLSYQLENDTIQTKKMEKQHEMFSDCIALLNNKGMRGVVQT